MILKDLVPFYSGPGAEAEVTGITADSRRVQPGFVFAAMQEVIRPRDDSHDIGQRAFCRQMAHHEIG